jgi:hypothetical protein
MSPVPPAVTDHVEQALADLLSKYSPERAPRLRRLVTVEATQSQEVEDAFQELLTERYLDNAEGVQLDLYGKLVGNVAASRGALTDDDYRRFIRVAIQINRSDGGAEQAIQIMAQIVEVPVEYSQYNPAHYQLAWVTDDPVSADVLQRISLAMPLITASGVSWELVQGEDADETFRYDAGPGYDLGKLATKVG